MTRKTMAQIMEFQKYQGLGNDFVILDLDDLDSWAKGHLEEKIRRIADRRFGIGCDQVMVILPPLCKNSQYDGRIRIFNTDGSEAESCGNGTRCVVRYLSNKMQKCELLLDTPTGNLKGKCFLHNDDIEVEQGKPNWIDPNPIDLTDISPELKGYGVTMGNPHLVIFVTAKHESILKELETVGPKLENNAKFPNRTNVEFCNIEDDGIRVFMWERGAGRTLACGSGACAAAFAALKTRLIRTNPVKIKMEGGNIFVTLDQHGKVFQRGPAAFVFKGEIPI